MALKTVISSFPIFSPIPTTTPSAATTTVIRFSRWNNANAEEFNVRRLNQESLELDIRRLRRFNSVVNITSNYSPPPSSPPQPPPYKSAGTPSSPSLSSIPGRKSKYSKPDYRNDRNAPGYSRPSRRNYGGEPRVAFRRVPVSETAGNGEETGDFRPNRRNYGNTSGGDAHVAGNGGETGDFRPNRRNYGNTPERGPRVVYRNIPLPGKTEIGGKSSQTKPNRLNGAHPAFRRLTRWTKLPRGETEENNVGETEVKVRDEGGGLSYVVPGAPFEFMYSYTEAPKGVKPVALREEAVAPFGLESMGRPWTGRKPLSKKLLAEMDSFKPPPPGKKGVKSVQRPGPYVPGTGPRYVMSREEILGEELTKEEVTDLIEGSRKAKRQLNMGRDGLTHNMLDNIHAHWKRRRVCKVKCKGVCTVDMDNVCEQLEEKTGGKIIYRRGGVLFLFRGRNYNFKTRPRFPLMLWKPITPVFPRLVQRVPEGLTLEEATAMRKRGRDLIPICKLGKNGVYVNLVKTVREAFEVCDLVRVNCQGLNPSDYRKIGAKLKDLVPCVLISFEYEHILIWRGKEWKPSLMLPEAVNKEYQVSESDRDAFLGPDTSPSDDEQESESESCSDIPNGKTCDEIRDLSEALTNDSNVGALGSEDEILDLSKALTNDSNVGALGSEDTFVVKDDEPSNVNGVIPNQTNTIGTKTLKSEVTSGSNNNSDNDVKSGACTDERESTNSASCQSSDSEGVMESFSRSSAVNAELQAMVENTPDSSHSSKASQCTEGVLLLLRQALDSGSAVSLDVTSLDADAIYEKSVAVARVAPPEPAFIHQTRKVVIRKSENQENGDVEMHEVVDEPVPEKKSSKKASKEKKKPTTQKKEDFKEDFLNIVPQGSLGIDELAKLLA